MKVESAQSTCNNDCGDGTLGTGEECDDNNTNDLDGCDSSCNVEDGFLCTSVSPSVCST